MRNLSIVGLASAGCLVIAGSLALTAEAKTPEKLDDLISGYRAWHKVNAKPIHMAPQIAMLCRGPASWQTHANPHDPKFFTVYVNKTGVAAMKKQGLTQFPAGSIIVKEKLPTESGQPELLTVMVKKEAGFDPKHGDWQYFTADGDGNKTSQDDVAKCQSCHEVTKENDYVFRSYVQGANQPQWKRGW
jgi:hypothetical protein